MGAFRELSETLPFLLCSLLHSYSCRAQGIRFLTSGSCDSTPCQLGHTSGNIDVKAVCSNLHFHAGQE